MSPSGIATIGHSNHPLEKFVQLLGTYGTTAVADVRSQPYSKFNPAFNREILMRKLADQGITYEFLGANLGARSEDPECYENGRVQYRRLARTELFRSGIRRLQAEAERHKLVIMCAEQEPLDCHRTILVGRELVDDGTDVVHIHSDGKLESHAEAMRRLLGLLGWPDQEDLFRNYDQILDEAYAEQEKRIAYVNPNFAIEGTRGNS